MDIPASQHATVQQCIVQAAAHYGAHPLIVQSVQMTENGKVGQARRNTNGTEDVGPMQINSVHFRELANYGITRDKLLYDGCLNVYIGTYYLQKSILKTANFWRAVGNYHSTTPSLNVEYQQRVWANLQKLQAQRGALR